MYPDANIILTGHSLGGRIAQALGAETGAETVMFSAYGVGNLYNVNAKYTDNITNYGNAQDGVYVKNIDNQLGKTIILNTHKSDNEVFKKGYALHGVAPRFLENYSDLSQGVEYNDYNPEEVFDTKTEFYIKGNST